MFAATENDSIYALDASTGQVRWQVSAGTPVPAAALPCGDISPTVGITSTPVIDLATGAIYVVADTWDGTNAHHVLVGFDLATGARVLGPETIDPPDGDNPLDDLQRPALNLDGDEIVIGFGGNDGDCGSYHGALLAAPTAGGAPRSYIVPVSREGAIWGVSGPAVDANGSIYAVTGNGEEASCPASFDHSDSVIKFDATLAEQGYFAPSSWCQDSQSDADLGSAGALLLPGNELFVDGKNGTGYLVSTTTPGGIDGQLFDASVCASFGGDAFAGSTIFVACSDGVRALSLNAAGRSFSSLWHGPSDADGPPIVAAGTVWVVGSGSDTLYGLDPASGSVRVHQSLPGAEHFTSPSAADGRLLISTGDTISAFTIAAAPPSTVTPVTPATPVPARARCVVPRLRGHSLAYARRLLARARCRLGAIHRPRLHLRRGQRAPALLVVAQSHRPGARLPAGSRVTVRLAQPRPRPRLRRR